MDSKDFYSNAHVFVAAVRVLTYQRGTPPTVEQVCGLLSVSSEWGHHCCSRLAELEIIEAVKGAYGNRIFVKDHLKLEQIPREDSADGLQEAIRQFKESQKGFSKEIESFQLKQERKKKDLFAEMEKKLKQQMGKE